MISAPKDILLFNIDDCARQVCAIKVCGGRPLRVRVSAPDWIRMTASPFSPEYLAAKMGKPAGSPTLLGIPVRVDDDWRGPITVETLVDQKPA